MLTSDVEILFIALGMIAGLQIASIFWSIWKDGFS